jgi:hypothetical protein
MGMPRRATLLVVGVLDDVQVCTGIRGRDLVIDAQAAEHSSRLSGTIRTRAHEHTAVATGDGCSRHERGGPSTTASGSSQVTWNAVRHESLR